MINVIGLIAVFIVAYFIRKTANENGRNGLLWAFFALAVGIGSQLVLPLVIVISLGLVYLLLGIAPLQMQAEIMPFAQYIAFGCIVLSIIAMSMLLRYIARIPDHEPAVDTPPPPPAFSGDA